MLDKAGAGIISLNCICRSWPSAGGPAKAAVLVSAYDRTYLPGLPFANVVTSRGRSLISAYENRLVGFTARTEPVRGIVASSVNGQL